MTRLTALRHIESTNSWSSFADISGAGKATGLDGVERHAPRIAWLSRSIEVELTLPLQVNA
jgi:hypothetical protein